MSRKRNEGEYSREREKKGKPTQFQSAVFKAAINKDRNDARYQIAVDDVASGKSFQVPIYNVSVSANLLNKLLYHNLNAISQPR